MPQAEPIRERRRRWRISDKMREGGEGREGDGRGGKE
jgi:hypothetical protein